MSNYAKHLGSIRSTPQTKAIPGRTNMVKNDGGGFSFAVDKWTRLNRFLIQGCEGGHFQVGEAKMTVDNATSIFECVAEDPARTVAAIVEISESGRAPKNASAVFALALVAGSKETRTFAGETPSQMALRVLPRVCTYYTDLADFIKNVQEFRGWGRALRNAIARWYNDKPVADLAYQMTKYQNRNGFTQRDVLRLSHPKTTEHDRNYLYRYAVGKAEPDFALGESLKTIEGFEQVKVATTEKQVVKLIRDYRLVREHIPTQFLNSPAVWNALLEHMPMWAMIRNVNKMTSIGLIAPMSLAARKVNDALHDVKALQKSRVHPFKFLLAQTTYAAGHGVKGDLTWTPVAQITDALQDAFYNSFAHVEPTNKRHYLAIDVSASMSWAQSRIADTHIHAREGAACMAMVTLRTERQSYCAAFSNGMVDLGISGYSRLDDVVNRCSNTPAAGTNCAAPILDALAKNMPVDTFVIYTDSDTNSAQTEHPIQALDRYRQQMGINAKLAVVSMAANGHSIADPKDAGTLDIAGFDGDTPSILAEFTGYAKKPAHADAA